MERHVKYSGMIYNPTNILNFDLFTMINPRVRTSIEVHMKNVQKMKDRENKVSEPVESLEEVEKKLTQQIEGEHYRLLYSGSKMFWRTKDNIDLHIYLHVIPDCIEVVPFDIERHKELGRIYLGTLSHYASEFS